jgi:AAA15 family ATPase/GTPase
MKKETIELMQLFDADIEDVDIVTPTPRQTFVSVKQKKIGRAPLSTFGDGLRQAFTLAASVPGVRNGLLLVDELEEAIHVDVLGKVFDWLIKACIRNDVQLFATTHSLEAIDKIITACHEETIDLVAYRLENYEERKTVTRLEKGLLTRLRENMGMEVR